MNSQTSNGLSTATGFCWKDFVYSFKVSWTEKINFSDHSYWGWIFDVYPLIDATDGFNTRLDFVNSFFVKLRMHAKWFAFSVNFKGGSDSLKRLLHA